MTHKRENKLRTQIKGAESILDKAVVGIRSVKERKDIVRALIKNTEYSNIKRAFWCGYFLIKFKEDAFGDENGS